MVWATVGVGGSIPPVALEVRNLAQTNQCDECGSFMKKIEENPDGDDLYFCTSCREYSSEAVLFRDSRPDEIPESGAQGRLSWYDTKLQESNR